MSLDKNTIEWLEKRKPPTEKPWPTTADDNFCKHCKQRITDCVPWYRNTGDCPTDRGGDFRDAAEFEARVAAKMASTLRPCENCPDFLQAPRCPALGLRPYYCMLRNARLAVEAEMEQEGK